MDMFLFMSEQRTKFKPVTQCFGGCLDKNVRLKPNAASYLLQEFNDKGLPENAIFKARMVDQASEEYEGSYDLGLSWTSDKQNKNFEQGEVIVLIQRGTETALWVPESELEMKSPSSQP